MAEAEAIDKIFGRPGPAGHLHQGRNRAFVRRRGSTRGRRLCAIDRPAADPAHGGSRATGPGDPPRHRQGRRPGVGARARLVEQLRFRRAQWMHRARTLAWLSHGPRGVVSPRRRSRRPEATRGHLTAHSQASVTILPGWSIRTRSLGATASRSSGRGREQRFHAWSVAAGLLPAHRIVKVGWTLGRAVGAWYCFDRGRGRPRSRTGLSRRLRIAFGKLGPTYIKLGQILSSGDGIFPEEIVSQFRLLA